MLRVERSSPISVYALRGNPDDEYDEKQFEPIMNGWEILSFDSSTIDIELNFTNPLYVSSGDKPDLLLIQIDLGEYKSKRGVNMPESIVKYTEIPT